MKRTSHGPFNEQTLAILKALRLYRPLQSQMNRILLPKTVKFYSQFVRKGQLCFDIGANVGDRTEAFLKLGARVIVVEPQTDCMRILKRKYQDNQMVVLIAAAADQTEGVRLLHICTEDKMSSLSSQWIQSVTASGRYSRFKWPRSEKVNVVTLDSLIKKYGIPDFCKIDVEGYELNVIRGLSSPIPLMSFEFTPEMIPTAVQVIGRLEQLGRYSFNYSQEGSMKLGLKSWAASEELVKLLYSMTVNSQTGDLYAKLA